MVSVRVLALGNVLVGDDGAGPYALQVLEAGWEFPGEVELLDVGTPGFDLLPLFQDLEALVFLDTVQTADPPGTVRVFHREEIVATTLQPRTSPHDPGLRDALLEAEFRGFAPCEVALIGVVPDTVAAGTALTDPVRAAIPRLAEAAVAELARLGHAPSPRAEPLPLDVWWEHGAPRDA